MARAAHMDLQLMTVRHGERAADGHRRLSSRTPSNTAHAAPAAAGPTAGGPREPLELPPAAQFGTLILRDVGGLPPVDQCRLLRWLELSARPHAGRQHHHARRCCARVEAGVFLDTLYYRLNTVCVDVTN